MTGILLDSIWNFFRRRCNVYVFRARSVASQTVFLQTACHTVPCSGFLYIYHAVLCNIISSSLRWGWTIHVKQKLPFLLSVRLVSRGFIKHSLYPYLRNEWSPSYLSYDCFKHLCVRHCYKNQEANVSSFAVGRECEAPQAARCLPTGGAHGKICGSRFRCFSRYLVTSDGKQRRIYTLIYTSVYIYLFIQHLETREEERPPSCKRHGMLAGYAEIKPGFLIYELTWVIGHTICE